MVAGRLYVGGDETAIKFVGQHPKSGYQTDCVVGLSTL